MKSQQGRRRWFLHKRGGIPIADSQTDTSFLQQQFVVLAHNEYGQDKSDLPPQARKHL